MGQVVQALKAKGVFDNTIVIFTSDNGGERFSKTWPFTGQKTELLEGGIRVPTLLSWPARLQPQVSEQVTITMDWLPTLLSAAGTAPHPDYPSDGENILPVLQGQAPVHERRLFWRWVRPDRQQRAARFGQWKLLVDGNHLLLFDLGNDPGERADLAARHPDLVATLKRLLAGWEADVDRDRRVDRRHG